MTGHYSSVAAQVHKVAAQVQWTHCSMYQETVAVTKMQINLKSVLDSIVKTWMFKFHNPIALWLQILKNNKIKLSLFTFTLLFWQL